MPSASRFQYEPLPPDLHTFRFASLMPGAPDEPIQVKLELHVIGKNQDSTSFSYEALSWVWGPYGESRPIYVNGHEFEVTRNLYIALSHLRETDHPRVLWVDALCIDQSNLAERSSQIGQMAFLFHRATRVVAWLGEGGPGTRIVFKLARNLFNFENGELSSCDENMIYILALTFGVPNARVNPSNSTFHYWNIHKFDNWDHVDSLADRELFRRAWVIQECALARQLLLQCGADTIPWDPFYRAVSLRYSHDDRHAQRLSSIKEGWSAIRAIEYLRHLVATRQRPPDLLEFIRACKNYRSTDERDRIFALLGISNLLFGHDSKYQIGFEIDYTVPTADVFRSFTMSMILKYGDLRVLGTRRPNRVFDDKGLGSWCPDWAALDDGVSLLYLQQQWSGNPVRYHAATPISSESFRQTLLSNNPDPLINSSARPPPKSSIHPASICLRGYLLDTVQDVRHTSHFDSDDARLYDWHHWAVWPEEREWTETPQSRVDADPQRQDAFWRTMIADADANGNRHPVYLRTQFLAWYQRILEGFKSSSGPSTQDIGVDDYKDFLNRMRQVMKGRSLFETTEHSLLGIGDEDTSAELGGPQLRAGDIIAILDGGQLPVMLRKVPEQSLETPTYRVIGDAFCYIHGASDGEFSSIKDHEKTQFLII